MSETCTHLLVTDTVYAPIGGDGLGRVLDDALRDGGDSLRRVVLVGPRLGDSNRVMRGWLGRLGAWLQLGEPYVGPSSIRMRVGRDGHELSVSWAAAWFGDIESPAAVAEATKHVRHIVGRGGARMVGTPSTTGLAMLRAYWSARDWDFATAPPEVQSLIRSTSGQGRFELLDRGRERGGRALVSLDARFQYAAIARTIELGVGEPVEVGAHDPEPYATAWVEVEVVVGDDAPPFGLLGVFGADGKWRYPARGRFVTWAHWCEVELARQHGYRCTVRRGYVWPKRARVLAGWASSLIRERDRITGAPGVEAPVIEAVRAACRALTIQTIGVLHGRDVRRTYTVGDASEIPADAEGWAPTPDGRWSYTVRESAAARQAYAHPEWTAHLWAVARCRLARQMLRCDPSTLVAVALDSVYVTKPPPVIEVDDGRAGRWRVTSTAGSWQPFESMTGVYRHMAAAK